MRRKKTSVKRTVRKAKAGARKYKRASTGKRKRSSTSRRR